MHIPTKAVLAAECHLRGINDASADDTQIELIQRLSSYHKLRNEHPTLIPEMTVAGKEGLLILKQRVELDFDEVIQIGKPHSLPPDAMQFEQHLLS